MTCTCVLACQTPTSNISEDGPMAALKNIFNAAHEKCKKAAIPMTNELDHYLAAEPDPMIDNALVWWSLRERRTTYPALLHMASCYLTIPCEYSLCSLSVYTATSVGVKRLFSKGQIIVTHLCNGLSAASICALICLNNWSPLGFVRDTDVLAVTTAADEDPEEVQGNNAWAHV